ncbi:MAG: ribosome small subunit-dependent GTPase A, partial [Candidatus Dormibacteraceae bacterium]
VPAPLQPALRRAGRAIAVGDWVALRPPDGAISTVLPRTTAISRRTPEAATKEQVLAANVDLVLLAMAVDGDFNLRRLERMLTAAFQSGAEPLIVLTKADLGGAGERGAEARAVAPGVTVVAVSASQGTGIGELAAHLTAGRTAVLLGQSGVGKSTLVNLLAGRPALRTGDVHGATGQGRHTTSHRELLQLPRGGCVIDTPGLREVQLWEGDEGLDDAFGDVERLARRCRFSDCAHDGEPGCAVAQALEQGELEPHRWQSYRKLQRELRSVTVRVDVRARGEERRRWRSRRRAAAEQEAAKRYR